MVIMFRRFFVHNFLIAHIVQNYRNGPVVHNVSNVRDVHNVDNVDNVDNYHGTPCV